MEDFLKVCFKDFEDFKRGHSKQIFKDKRLPRTKGVWGPYTWIFERFFPKTMRVLDVELLFF